MSIDGKAAVAVGVGGILVYTGVRGYSVLKAVQNVVQGQAASNGQTVNPISAGNAPVNESGQFTSQSGLVEIAEQYIGHKYVFGGAPGVNGEGGWDCSSYMNFVIGARAGMAIPGVPAGGYDGATHGPPTTAWLVWTGCTTVSAANAVPGDLVVGATHMGMFLGSGQYVSAHDPEEGTTNSAVSTFPDPLMLYRRLKA